MDGINIAVGLLFLVGMVCGVPLAVVSEMLGHKHDRTTQRYAHLTGD